MIPEHIWEKQCKYCSFRESDENKRIDRYHGPCSIGCLGADDETPEGFLWIDGKEISTREYYKTNPCGSWRSNNEYGLCKTCEYFNPFHDENKYCTHTDGPLNRILVHNTRPEGPADSWKYVNCHCDRYKPDHYWKDTMIKQALSGRIPKNFNPETWEPTEPIEGDSVEWAFQRSEQEYQERKKKMQEIQKRNDKAAEKNMKKKAKDKLDYVPDGQMSMFDFL